MDLDSLIHDAIQEDMPNGDLTTEALGVLEKPGRAKLIAKEDLVLSGVEPFEKTMHYMEPLVKFKWFFKDGDFVLKGQTICVVEGNLVQILKAERVALNFVGHLSGIATYTRCFVNELGTSKTKILDTRKTLPGYRSLQKKAVVHGKGFNHRQNLSSAILIKNNHISLMGGLTKAVQAIRSQVKKPIEVEARTLVEVKEAVAADVERILLDNMDDQTLSEAIRIIPKSIETEASGNMSVARVKKVAAIGVNYISVGAITHSAPTADVSLHFDWEK